MPRYWVMAPVESKPADIFDKVWQFDLAQNVISTYHLPWAWSKTDVCLGDDKQHRS